MMYFDQLEELLAEEKTRISEKEEELAEVSFM